VAQQPSDISRFTFALISAKPAVTSAQRDGRHPNRQAVLSRQGGSTWKVGYKLMKQEGWTESQAMNFISAAVPVYCPIT